MRAAFFLALLALLASPVFASQLFVKVTVTQGTLAVGTNVSIVTQGVELAQKKADINGIAAFNVSDGSYFVLLRRYPYPLHVSLVEVSGNTNVTLTMRQLISYANAYGQIFGPADFANSSLAAYSGGVVAKRVTPNKNGFYTVSFLPEGDYELEFSVPGYRTKRVEASLPNADFIEVNANLEKTLPPEEPNITISAPQEVQQYSLIEAVLSKGTSPLSGETVGVETPSGRVLLTSDASGKVRINAAEAGAYKFTYGAISFSTSVVAKEKPAPQEPQPQAPPQQAQPPSQPSEEQKTNYAVAAGALVGIFAAIVIVVVLVLAYRYFSGKKAKKHEHHKKE